MKKPMWSQRQQQLEQERDAIVKQLEQKRDAIVKQLKEWDSADINRLYAELKEGAYRIAKARAATMTVDTNSTPLAGLFVLAADVLTIGDAAKYIRELPSDFAGRIHWQLAGAVLKAADANPGNADLLGTATLAFKNALETDRIIAEHPK
jgi:hypothetical protein